MMQKLGAKQVLGRHLNQKRRKGICNIEFILKELEGKGLLNKEDANLLSVMDVENGELYSKQPFDELSTAIQGFALMLNYYTPEGYTYVVANFDVSLPHPRVVRKWYMCDDGNPGFTKESIEALKLKANSVDHQLYCCLTVNNIQITRDVEYDDKMTHGYVEFGQNSIDDFVSDMSSEVREAYVFLVSCINGNFRVPVGYFMADEMRGVQIKNLIVACLELLHETGINIVALSLDTSPSYRTAASLLGCKLDPDYLDSTFDHPVTEEPIAVFFDPCKLLQSIRITLVNYKSLRIAGEKLTKWYYVKKLYEIQEKGSGPALKSSPPSPKEAPRSWRHPAPIERPPPKNLSQSNTSDKKKQIMFYSEKMKLNVTLELFSGSLADTMEIFFDSDCEPTINFIRNFNNMINIYNSRHLKSEHEFSKPLSLQNKGFVFNFFSSLENYIKTLRSSNPTLATSSCWGFGLIGFLVNMNSIRHLFENLVETERIKFLPLSKLSPEELALLFYNARSYGGHRMSIPPTTKQFKLFYKEVINNLKMKKTESGKYVELEKISVLNYCSGITTINATINRSSIANDYEDDTVNKKEFNVLLGSHNNTLIKCDLFSKLPLQTVIFFAGFVVQFLIKKLKCEACLDVLSGSKKDKSISFKVIHFEYKDELIIPSVDVIKICKVIEQIFKPMCKVPNDKTPEQIKQEILYKALRSLIGSDIFKSLNNHQFEQSPMENHVVHLLRAVAEVYIDVRFRYLDKTLWVRQRFIEGFLKLF